MLARAPFDEQEEEEAKRACEKERDQTYLGEMGDDGFAVYILAFP